MTPEKKQKAKKITSSFLGNEADNQKLLSQKNPLRYSPNVEFFVNAPNESLVAVIRSGEALKDNPVYRITDIKLIRIIESFADATHGIIYYYKVPNESFEN